MIQKLVYGAGINDIPTKVTEKGRIKRFYEVWREMVRRCCVDSYKELHPTYKMCTVCEEWKTLSTFKKWYDENYIDEWQLDKDLLVKGNKVYSPETCCFLPREINNYLANNKRWDNKRGGLPTGLRYVTNKVKGHTYQYLAVIINVYKQTKFVGSFSTIEEALLAYSKAREDYAKVLANKYKDKLDKRAYDALMNYREKDYESKNQTM